MLYDVWDLKTSEGITRRRNWNSCWSSKPGRLGGTRDRAAYSNKRIFQNEVHRIYL